MLQQRLVHLLRLIAYNRDRKLKSSNNNNWYEKIGHHVAYVLDDTRQRCNINNDIDRGCGCGCDYGNAYGFNALIVRGFVCSWMSHFMEPGWGGATRRRERSLTWLQASGFCIWYHVGRPKYVNHEIAWPGFDFFLLNLAFLRALLVWFCCQQGACGGRWRDESVIFLMLLFPFLSLLLMWNFIRRGKSALPRTWWVHAGCECRWSLPLWQDF